MWPQLDAILVVPNNAHALFAKPLVVSPAARLGVDFTAADVGLVALTVMRNRN